MDPTSNDSQKLPKIIFIPNPPNEIKFCFCFFYQISLHTAVSDRATNRSQFMGYTSSCDSSRRERRESPFRKSSICIPSSLLLMNVDCVTFCFSKLRSWRSKARCCLFAYNSTTVKMTHSRVNIMTATSDNLSGTKSTWDRYGCLVSMNSFIFLAHSL